MCTDMDAQAEQVVHCATHAAGGSSVERGVALLVLTVDLSSTFYQKLHDL